MKKLLVLTMVALVSLGSVNTVHAEEPADIEFGDSVMSFEEVEFAIDMAEPHNPPAEPDIPTPPQPDIPAPDSPEPDPVNPDGPVHRGLINPSTGENYFKTEERVVYYDMHKIVITDGRIEIDVCDMSGNPYNAIIEKYITDKDRELLRELPKYENPYEPGTLEFDYYNTEYKLMVEQVNKDNCKVMTEIVTRVVEENFCEICQDIIYDLKWQYINAPTFGMQECIEEEIKAYEQSLLEFKTIFNK